MDEGTFAGVPRATALRLIQTLEPEGLLIRVLERDRVLLGPELVRLARQVDMTTILVGAALSARDRAVEHASDVAHSIEAALPTR